MSYIPTPPPSPRLSRQAVPSRPPDHSGDTVQTLPAMSISSSNSSSSSTSVPGSHPYWGYLSPLFPSVPYPNLYFSRSKRVYTVGGLNTRDIYFCKPVIPNHQCTFIWDGTDNANAVQVTAVYVNELCTISINRMRLRLGEPVTLRHGDYISFTTSFLLDEDDDLRFVWLQHTKEGQLPWDGTLNDPSVLSRDSEYLTWNYDYADDHEFDEEPWADEYTSSRY
ncbi:hypothetical protein AcW1_001400 [Taiwanofungus camphoratus]|nr:hypothetical protein AcW2_000068 [Antrodia cinnamomea]KAI0937411.1 hypothetical protein AcV5_005327 [Antrodia cinnamomea]KAI0962622.1 hypothetical protein AcV7_001425 [Antrodia cinnamomea]KAI0964623.1 hypothetical protein AcW1_001400 [Antrodia cinnamomea]